MRLGGANETAPSICTFGFNFHPSCLLTFLFQPPDHICSFGWVGLFTSIFLNQKNVCPSSFMPRLHAKRQGSYSSLILFIEGIQFLGCDGG